MTTTNQARKTLAELNQGFRSEGETADFETATEYRVGKWGLAWSRDGYSGRGPGGDKLHLSVVTYITAIKPDYNWQAYCTASAYVSRSTSKEEAARRRARQLEEHAGVAAGTFPGYSHSCRQPKVGDVTRVNPVCRYENVRGTAAWEPSEADTNMVNCTNCRRGFFNEEVDVDQERKAARATVEERKAAKPKPARCFWCGDIRPKTKATERGEQLPCSYCKDQFETIWWVETSGYTCQYHVECVEFHDAAWAASMQAAAVKSEDEAYTTLERREGKYR